MCRPRALALRLERVVWGAGRFGLGARLVAPPRRRVRRARPCAARRRAGPGLRPGALPALRHGEPSGRGRGAGWGRQVHDERRRGVRPVPETRGDRPERGARGGVPREREREQQREPGAHRRASSQRRAPVPTAARTARATAHPTAVTGPP